MTSKLNIAFTIIIALAVCALLIGALLWGTYHAASEVKKPAEVQKIEKESAKPHFEKELGKGLELELDYEQNINRVGQKS